ncbi:hypothetical protein WA1_37280 [Scytonema hofmannii PCC 7110]|uniref:Uncharacterized protein n=1 Tax=Scytonema hofmannii PCC 7110 TaxID=128403 RepID=A0A139X1C7_9CYAN|nr:hypothetical protein [Scytonema hofmannii]KYC38432.1 hypothetical protein WA1_37280 [Scytonema hofmannii PCC 7110]
MTATTVFQKQYVEWRENGYWIKESRVSLDSVVYAFLNGTSPEAYLKEGEAEFEKLRQAAREQNTVLYEKLALHM